MIALPNVEESYRMEFIRKGIHLCSLSIPVAYFYISKAAALWVLVPLALLFGLTDLARMYYPPFRAVYHRYFGFLLRSHELDEKTKKLNGATYVLLSAILCIVIFPKLIVISAFAILIVSDTMAALIGRKFGRHRFSERSFEGSAAFFLSAVFVIALSPKVHYLPGEYAVGAAAALIGAIVEAFSNRIDDNLTIPLSIGAVLWGLYALLLPALNVYALDAIL